MSATRKLKKGEECVVFLSKSHFLKLISYNYILQKSYSRIGFFTIFGLRGPLFKASVIDPFRKSYAFDIRKMYKMAISRPFLMLFFNPLKCKILLLALVFSLFWTAVNQPFLSFLVKKSSPVYRWPSGTLARCFVFYTLATHFRPEAFFDIFTLFSTFFKFLHEWLLSQNIAFRFGKTHIRENPLDELLRLRIFLDAAKRPKYCFSLR